MQLYANICMTRAYIVTDGSPFHGNYLASSSMAEGI